MLKTDLMTLRLNDGQSARLTGLYVCATYGGMLGGRPSPSANQAILNGMIQTARTLFGWAGQEGGVVMLPHTLVPAYELFGSPERLPFFTCMGRFESTSPTRGAAGDGSTLLVVWLQEEPQAWISPACLAELLKLDWSSHALNFEF